MADEGPLISSETAPFLRAKGFGTSINQEEDFDEGRRLSDEEEEEEETHDGKPFLGPKAGENKTLQVYFTIINGFVGGGMLAMPYGFRSSGYVLGIIALIAIALLSDYTLKLLVRMKMIQRDHSISTYADIGYNCFGSFGSVAVNLSIIFSQFGYCCAYLVFIGKNLSTLSFLTRFHFGANEILFVFVLPIVTLLVFLRNLRFLSRISWLSNVAIMASVIAVLVYGFTNDPIAHKDQHYTMFDFKDLAVYYGIVAFAYTQHGLILEVHATMKEPNKFGTALDPAISFTTLIYLVFGLFGYLFFGDKTPDVITCFLDGIEADILRISLSTVLIFAYPLQMFPVVKIVEGYLCPPPETQPDCYSIWNKTHSGIALMSLVSLDTWKRNIIRLLLIGASFGAAVGVPLFADFSSLVGCFSNSFIAFIFPPLFYLKLYGKSFPRWKIVGLVAIMLFGIFGMGVGSTLVLDTIIKKLRNPTHSSSSC